MIFLDEKNEKIKAMVANYSNQNIKNEENVNLGVLADKKGPIELNMELIKEFANKAKIETESFVIESKTDDERIRYQFNVTSGENVKYISLRHISCNGDDSQSEIDFEDDYKLIAIVKDKDICICDEIYFTNHPLLWKKCEEENFFIVALFLHLQNWPIEFEDDLTVWNLKTIKNVMNTYADTKVFSEFYDSLEAEDINDSENTEKCYYQARKYLLFGHDESDVMPKGNYDFMFNELEAIYLLSNSEELKKEILINLNKDKEKWVLHKSLAKKTKEIIENGKAVEDWELEISEIIRKTLSGKERRSVNVEFTLNGKTGVLKRVSGVSLVVALTYKRRINKSTLPNTKEVKKFLADLDACDAEDKIQYRHISKITYRNKTIYERNLENKE